MVPHYQNNQNKDLPYSSSGNFQNNILYGSSGVKLPDTIKDLLNEQNRDSKHPWRKAFLTSS